jgi:hypothetical protein
MLFVEDEAAFVEHYHHIGGSFAFDSRGGLQKVACGSGEGRRPWLRGVSGGVEQQGHQPYERVRRTLNAKP